MSWRWCVSLVALFLAGCVNRSDNSGVLTPDKIVVAPGETLYFIAYKYRVPAKQLIAYNDLVPPYRVKAGDILVIPPLGKSESRSATAFTDPVIAAPPTQNHPLFVGQTQNPASTSVLPSQDASAALLNAHELKDELQREKAKLNVKKDPPFPWPLTPLAITEFRRAGKVEGLFLRAKEGTAVQACHQGKVFFVGDAETLGCIVIVESESGWLSVYGNISSPYVKIGHSVAAGTPLGLVGAAARGHGSHLYLEIRRRTPGSKRTVIMDTRAQLEKESTRTEIKVPNR